MEAGKCVKVNFKVTDDLGELELGKLDQESFKDPDLREILAKTVLDASRMEGLENQELRLIYSVIYSERFLLNGRQKHEEDAGINVALPEVLAEFLPQLKGKYKKRTTPPKAATRNIRGPIFCKFVCVNYDKEQRRLDISQGKFAGKHPVDSRSVLERGVFELSMRACMSSVERDIKKRDKAEYTETILDMEKEDIDMSDEDVKKLEIIKKAVLISTESREERKERVKKYLNWFEEALLKGQKKVSLFEPLTNEDRKFLRSIYCPALPNQPSVDLESLDEEKIQGYAIVLKQIDDFSEKHWDEIEKDWAQAEQNE